MPTIVAKSISILSDAGLGMAMFSLGGCPRPLCCCLPVPLHLQLRACSEVSQLLEILKSGSMRQLRASVRSAERSGLLQFLAWAGSLIRWESGPIRDVGVVQCIVHLVFLPEPENYRLLQKRKKKHDQEGGCLRARMWNPTSCGCLTEGGQPLL